MPYVTPNRRRALNPYIDGLAVQVNPAKRGGELMYIFARLVCLFYGRDSFEEISEPLKLFDASAKEYYSRVVTPFEDEKKKINGDVYERRDYYGSTNIKEYY